MLPAEQIKRAGAVRVNANEVELLLLQGWHLTDEPDCSGARMLPPHVVSVNRVPANEKAGRDGRREPARSQIDNARYSERRLSSQRR